LIEHKTQFFALLDEDFCTTEPSYRSTFKPVFALASKNRHPNFCAIFCPSFIETCRSSFKSDLFPTRATVGICAPLSSIHLRNLLSTLAKAPFFRISYHFGRDCRRDFFPKKLFLNWSKNDVPKRGTVGYAYTVTHQVRIFEQFLKNCRNLVVRSSAHPKKRRQM